MAELRRVTVEFDKNESSGKVYIEFSTELSDRNDRLALIAKVKKEVGAVLTEEFFSWSSIFKVTEVPCCSSGHKWFIFSLSLLRDNKPLEWSERLYEAYIERQVRQLCHFVKEHVDSFEKELLREKLPEVSKTIQFVED